MIFEKKDCHAHFFTFDYKSEDVFINIVMSLHFSFPPPASSLSARPVLSSNL